MLYENGQSEGGKCPSSRLHKQLLHLLRRNPRANQNLLGSIPMEQLRIPHMLHLLRRLIRHLEEIRLSRFKLARPPTPRDTEVSNAYAIMPDSLGPVGICSFIGINSCVNKPIGNGPSCYLYLTRALRLFIHF